MGTLARRYRCLFDVHVGLADYAQDNVAVGGSEDRLHGLQVHTLEWNAVDSGDDHALFQTCGFGSPFGRDGADVGAIG